MHGLLMNSALSIAFHSV